MGRLLLLILLFVTAISLLTAPWITGLAYVANSLIQPQYIWPWVFDGIPVFRITAGLAIIGLMFGIAQGKLDLTIYKQKQNFYVILLWLLMHLSHQFTNYPEAPASVSPELVLSTLNSIMVMYFVLLPLCMKENALKALCYVFISAGLYYTYWANSAYLNQEWWRFVQGRLTGPYRSPYNDANVLSTLIVMTMPFIILMVYRVKSVIYKAAFLLPLPLLWHALILLSSRGALLATVVTIVALAFVIKSKKFNIAMGLAFMLFMAYQGNLLLNRTTDTFEAHAVEVESPLNPRLVSWEAGLKLIPKYPLLGAGVQKYEAAISSHFPGMTPHVAHNTFINFSANTGLVSGIIFLGLVFIPILRAKKLIDSGELNLTNGYHYALTSSALSLIAFFVCSMFLDLIIFEPFYLVLLINTASWSKIIMPVVNKSTVTTGRKHNTFYTYKNEFVINTSVIDIENTKNNS